MMTTIVILILIACFGYVALHTEHKAPVKKAVKKVVKKVTKKTK